MATPSTAAPKPQTGTSATVVPELSVTDVASFVGLRQCGRYLRLLVNAKASAGASGAATSCGTHSAPVDVALTVAGQQHEASVARDLLQSAGDAPSLLPESTGGSTTWTKFLSLLGAAVSPPDRIPPDRNQGDAFVGCWAAEVVLRGSPTAGSVMQLSGRADYIILLWRGGRPVLRIVECKASRHPQTKFLVQLVLYRMILLRLLAKAGDAAGRLRFGRCAWAVVGHNDDDAAGVLDAVEVECVLHLQDTCSVLMAEPIPVGEVEFMARRIAAMLKRGGSIATVLEGPDIPLAKVPYELDSRCGWCPRVAECWADSAVSGAVQLSGCSAVQAQKLAAAGVKDIEDLAAVSYRDGQPMEASGDGDEDGGHSSVRRLALETGLELIEVQKLSLTARVRSLRRLGRQQARPPFARPPALLPPQPPQRPNPGRGECPGSVEAEALFLLLPGAPPSCLPDSPPTCAGSCWVRQPPALVRVFLSVAVDNILRRVVGVAAHVAALDDGSSAAAPLQGKQEGRDVVVLLRSVALDGQGNVANTAEELDLLEAGMLSNFSGRLLTALVEQHGDQPAYLHFYCHSRSEVTELIRRCAALASARSRHAADLAWLPHLLGLRADAAEQQMFSVLEDEVRRYATVWQGAGRLVATSVPWGGDGTFDWTVPVTATWGPGPATGAAATTEGSRHHSESRVDLRQVFAPGGYLDCLQPFDPQQHCMRTDGAAATQLQAQPSASVGRGNAQPLRRGQSLADRRTGTSAADLPQGCSGLVQERPDLTGSSIPPDFFRALWWLARTQTPQQEDVQGAPGQQGRVLGGEQRRALEDSLKRYMDGAAYLEALLLAQAHAVRWLEERLVRLASSGKSTIAKKPLLLPQLRTFRLTDGSPGLGGSVPRPEQGVSAEVASAALAAVRVNRGSELRAFWRNLGSRPPADRAASERGGTLVLDCVPLREQQPWLLPVCGRVVHPAGCTTWEELCEVTGLKDGDRVVLTEVQDPWAYQDTHATALRHRHGVIYGGGGAAGLWVKCCRDGIPYPRNGFFVLGSDGVSLDMAQRAQDFGARPGSSGSTYSGPGVATKGPGASVQPRLLVVDAAPNIAAWVATSVVECLEVYGMDSAYLAERLQLPHEVEGVHPPAEGAVGLPTTPRKEVNPSKPSAEPGWIGSTPGSVLGAHELLSPRSPDAADVPGAAAAASPPPISASRARGNVDGCSRDHDRAHDRLMRRVCKDFLHEDQLSCVRAFLSHPVLGSRVLLQGPPGTGKTETAAFAVLAWLAARMQAGGPLGGPDQGGLVLLSGPTHTAIRNLVERIGQRLVGGALDVVPGCDNVRKCVKLVRLPEYQKPLPTQLTKLGVTDVLPSSRETKTWYIIGGTMHQLKKVAAKLGTLMGADSRRPFAAALVVDEASMVFSPQLLALGSLLVARGSLLVAGDHRQLSTIVEHDFQDDLRPDFIRHRPYVSAYDYMRLLAEAGVRGVAAEPGNDTIGGGPPPPVSVCALTYTHRLPAAVTKLISVLYRLDGIELQGRPPLKLPLPPNEDAGGPQDGSVAAASCPKDVWRRLWTEAPEGVFLIVHNEEGSARFNTVEVEVVRRILEARPQAEQRGLRVGGQEGGPSSARGHAEDEKGPGAGGGKDVAIITPHRAQRRTLRALVKDQGLDCSVETVERMQGGEADTVIFSATVSDASALERCSEFYASLSRANVAFSRTRQRLIVAASQRFLTHLPTSHRDFAGLLLWRQLRSMCEYHGEYLGAAHVQVGAGRGAERPPTYRCDVFMHREGAAEGFLL